MPHVLATGLGLDGESRRHRQASAGHFGEACTFAAENIFHFAVAIGLAAAERVNVLGPALLIIFLLAFLHFSFGECASCHIRPLFILRIL